MKKALDSDKRGLEIFENDQNDGNPISSDRYNFHLHIKEGYENGFLVIINLPGKQVHQTIIPTSEA